MHDTPAPSSCYSLKIHVMLLHPSPMYGGTSTDQDHQDCCNFTSITWITLQYLYIRAFTNKVKFCWSVRVHCVCFFLIIYITIWGGIVPLAYCSVNFDSFNAYLWNQQTFPNIFALLNASVSSRNLNHFMKF